MAVDTQDLNPDFAQRLMQLIAASHGMIRITSGYRDNALQAKLYEQAKVNHPDDPGKWVAPPGKSNHNKGLAADLAGDMGLAHQLAPQFGLYFPMSWENWHIEPISTSDPNSPGNDPAAYTTSPYGDPNPTVQDRSQDTAYWAANIVNSLTGTPDPLGVGGGSASDTLPGVDFSKQPDAQSAAASGGSTTFTTGKGAADPSQIYAGLRAQGVDPVHAAALVAIASRESGFSPTAHNGNRGTGDDSYGLFQINLLGGQHSAYSPQMLSTTEGSIQAAADLVKSGGLQPWGGYKGVSWSHGVSSDGLNTAVAASNGEVTLQQLQALNG